MERGQLCTLTAEAATRHHTRDKRTRSSTHTTARSASWETTRVIQDTELHAQHSKLSLLGNHTRGTGHGATCTPHQAQSPGKPHAWYRTQSDTHTTASSVSWEITCVIIGHGATLTSHQLSLPVLTAHRSHVKHNPWVKGAQDLSQ